MGRIRHFRLAGSIAAAIVAAGVSMSVAQGAPVVASTETCLPKSLNAEQVSAIQASLIAALQNAWGYKHATPLQSSSLPQQKGSVQVEKVIAQAVINGIAQYGADLAGSITSAVIETSEEQGVPPSAIGRGLAQAAATEAAANSAAASAIAKAVAKEGNKAEIVAFQTAVTSLGYANLAAIAGSPPTLGDQVACAPQPQPVKTADQGGLIEHTYYPVPLFPSGGGAGGTIAGCLNPSCTKM